MFYITVKQSPMYSQMSLEAFLFQPDAKNRLINSNTANTRTYVRDSLSERFASLFSVVDAVKKLEEFNESTEHLRNVERSELYQTFHIPKRSGGLRRIDTPKPELMEALRRLKNMFEQDFGALYHTAAFAYIKDRSTIDAIKRHQENKSKWFGKFDLADFFGSTTLDFVMSQLDMIFPFSEICRTPARVELAKALELAFLNGGLPQGTPISPLITNLMMIPIDYRISKDFRKHDRQQFAYTRYADDFIISSQYDFDVNKIEQHIVKVLRDFNAPFTIKKEKTRYGSSSGRNWNLGVMLNQDNEITVGHKRKKQFQSMLHNYIVARQSGGGWGLHDIQVLNGLRAYYLMVEPEAIKNILKHVNEKKGVDVVKMIKEDLRLGGGEN